MDVSTNSWLENAFLHTYLASFMSTTVRCPFIIIIVITIIIIIVIMMIIIIIMCRQSQSPLII